MIGRIIAYVHAVRTAPPTALTPVLAVAAILAGTHLLRRYTDYQRELIAVGGQELAELVAHIAAARLEVSDQGFTRAQAAAAAAEAALAEEIKLAEAGS